MRLQKQLSIECSLQRVFFQSNENIILSLIRKMNDSRETDVCLGKSTRFGYITSKLCCQADDIFLRDLETLNEFELGFNSFWTEENLCLINTTEIFEFNYPICNFEDKRNCMMLIYDVAIEQFIEHEIQLKINGCFESICSLKIDLNSNQIILNGTSILCDQSSHLAIVTKSKQL